MNLNLKILEQNEHIKKLKNDILELLPEEQFI